MNSDSLNVDGREYRFNIVDYPKWTSDGWRGLVLEVQSCIEAHRALIIQFPMEFSYRRSTPQRQRPKVDLKDLRQAIQAALKAGWEPESRGKPFTAVSRETAQHPRHDHVHSTLQGRTKRMRATARMASVMSSTRPGRRRLIRDAKNCAP